MTEKEKEEKKIPTVLTSKVIYNNDLLEQVYIPERNLSYYLRWDKKNEETIIMDKVEDGKIQYLPIFDDLLKKEVVILPSKTEEYGTEEDLELEIECFIKAWLDISDEHLQKATWYVMLSWVLDNLHTIPYLRALGDYGTGKTRYLDVIGGICYKPMFVGGAVRAAPIYRVIDLWRGTSIFDEFTLGKSDETQDIIQILNNGYQRGKPVLRCDSNNFEKVKAFDPFGAKILATRKEFYDKALESRCITEIMTTTPRSDVPIDLTENFFKQRHELQNKLLLYRFKNWEQIKIDDTISIDFGQILPRIKQSLSPFISLFQYDNERLKKFIDYVRDYNKKIVEENSSSMDGQIVNAYFELLETHDKNQETLDDYKPATITSSDIREYLINDGWDEKKINTRTIGKHFKTLGFELDILRIGGKTKKILKINDEKMKMLRMKYCVTCVTCVT